MMAGPALTIGCPLCGHSVAAKFAGGDLFCDACWLNFKPEPKIMIAEALAKIDNLGWTWRGTTALI
jgi:hypothetical protein